MGRKVKEKKTLVRRITEDEEVLVESVRKFGMDNFIDMLRSITQTGLDENNSDSLKTFTKLFISKAPRTLEEAVSIGMLTKETLEEILQGVREKKSIVFLGNLDTGKSTLLHALLVHDILRDQRITVLEKAKSCEVKTDEVVSQTSPLHVLDLTDTREVLKQILTKPEGYVVMSIEEKGDMYTLLNFAKQQPVIITSYWSLNNHFAMMEPDYIKDLKGLFTEDNTLVIQCTKQNDRYYAEVVKEF